MDCKPGASKHPECLFNERFESVFWDFRYLSIISVFVSFVVALLWFAAMLVDLIHMVVAGGKYLWVVLGHDVVFKHPCNIESLVCARNDLVYYSVEAIDAVLMAAIFLVFTYGLYELFISKIKTQNDTDDDQRIRGKILKIKDIDELKGKLVQLILMVLIVKMFYYGLTVELQPEGEPVELDDLLKLGGVVLMIALALFFSHSSVRYEGGLREDASPPADPASQD